MSTLTPESGRLGRPRLVAIVVALLVVALVLAGVVWYANRNDATTPANAATTPSPTAAATPTAAAGKAKPGTKATTKPSKPGSKVSGTTSTSGTTLPSGKKLPAGIAEPGREITKPVDVKATSIADSVRVDLTAFKSVKSQAKGPGEISAPAVRLTIRLTNTGSKRISLTSVVVNAYYGSSGTPGIQIVGDPATKAFTGSLAPGESATGVFVFNMPVSKRSEATITVSPSPTLPIAVFAGSVS